MLNIEMVVVVGKLGEGKEEKGERGGRRVRVESSRVES